MKYYMKSAAITALSIITVFGAGCAEAKPSDQIKASEVASDVTSAVKAVNAAPNWDIQADGSHIRFSAKQEGEKSVDAGSQDRNSTLPGKVWFSSKKFPSARFASSDISKQATGYLAKGELTLKGKSVPLELPFALQIDGDRAVMTGSVDIDRTLWNVGASPWDTDEWVSRAVKLDLQVTATLSK